MKSEEGAGRTPNALKREKTQGKTWIPSLGVLGTLENEKRRGKPMG